MDKRTAFPFLWVREIFHFPPGGGDGGNGKELFLLMRNLNNHFRVNRYTTLKPTISLTRGGGGVTDTHTRQREHISTLAPHGMKIWGGERERTGKWIPCPRIHRVSESKLDRVSDLFVSSDRIDCWMNWKEITFLPSVLQLLLLLLANETTAKSGQDEEKCLGFSENFSMWWLIRDHSSLFGPSSRRRIGSWMCSSIEKLLEDLSQVPVRVKNAGSRLSAGRRGRVHFWF